MNKLESAIEDGFTRQCKAHGFRVRKYATPGNAGAPDRIVFAGQGVVGWAELKRPGRPLDPLQVIEIRKMREAGCFVLKIDSAGDVAQFIATLLRKVRDAGDF